MIINKQKKVLTDDQLEKIGNAIIYISDKLGPLRKTQILKLLYLLDERSIIRSGIPFFNLDYKLWKYGPVTQTIFVDLSDNLDLLSKFLNKDTNNEFTPVVTFNDDEFSDNDIKLMDTLIDEFKYHNSTELVDFTHLKGSLWYKTAVENNCLDDLIKGRINNTDFYLNLKNLIADDQFKMERYDNYQEMF